MIQFNLLPDVKLEYIKAERTKRLTISVALLLTAASLAVFALLLFSVDVLQKKNINDLSADIKTSSAKLKGRDNLDKILTVQNQLNALPDLNAQKIVTSRLPGFISQVTPADATIGQLNVDFEQNTMTITGGAASLDTVNTFVDSLKFTKYVTGDNTSGDTDNAPKAFTSVVLTSFGKTDKGATYSITLNFEPAIFSEENDVTLVVPNIITTRSVLEHPNALFEGGN